MRFLDKNIFSFLDTSSLIFVLLFFIPTTSFGYVGPGLGAGTIGVILGAIAAVFLALFAVIWYPIKRLIKKKRSPKNQDTI